MNSATLQRYAPGGDIYAQLADDYGADNARRVYAVAQADGDVAGALAFIKWGVPLDESTASIFFGQLASDPLGAPLDAANAKLNQLAGNTLAGILRNPWVLLCLLALGVALWIKFFGVPKFFKK